MAQLFIFTFFSKTAACITAILPYAIDDLEGPLLCPFMLLYLDLHIF